MNSLTDFSFASGDAMVLSISFSNNFWTSIVSCNVLGGVISTSANQKAACYPSVSNNQIYITNIGGFETDPLLGSLTNKRIKIMFIGYNLTYLSSTAMTFNMILYANGDAYTKGYQGIFNRGNTLPNNCYDAALPSCYHVYNSANIGSF
jgi:hypothetical protein